MRRRRSLCYIHTRSQLARGKRSTNNVIPDSLCPFMYLNIMYTLPVRSFVFAEVTTLTPGLLSHCVPISYSVILPSSLIVETSHTHKVPSFSLIEKRLRF